MRELKDYFCTFTQKQQLLDLGFDGDSHIITAEYYYNISTPFEGILRNQALDFFRDLGYKAIKPMYNKSKRCHWFRFYYKNVQYHTLKQPTYHHAESALIGKLIELEKEARNEK